MRAFQRGDCVGVVGTDIVGEIDRIKADYAALRVGDHPGFHYARLCRLYHAERPEEPLSRPVAYTLLALAVIASWTLLGVLAWRFL